MKQLLREPLLHFLLLGGVFFLIYHLVNLDRADESLAAETITVSTARVQALGAQFEKTWKRAPTAAELDGLIENFIREEVYYREALALGLDRDDAIVRRRLRQKLQFMTEDLALMAEPDDRELQAFLDANPERYRLPARFSFSQVFLNPETRGEGVVEQADQVLQSLRAGADAATAGDRTLLPTRLEDEPDRNVERQFGGDFVEQLSAAPTAEWYGPLLSGFGVHLVFVETRVDAAAPELDAVRAAVTRDWTEQQRSSANEAVYQKLRERYRIDIEAPDSDADTAALAPRPVS